MESEGAHLSVPAGHPALPGHFPGRPIVPGVVILDLLAEDWRRRRPDAPLRGLRKMKFVAMLAPAQEFSVSWSEVRDGKVSFTAQSGGKPLATGQFVLA
jgi:3-hydroxymyristoyl/3-hydroxydecanoyl-(acyl carrier protein) dehydratase